MCIMRKNLLEKIAAAVHYACVSEAVGMSTGAISWAEV